MKTVDIDRLRELARNTLSQEGPNVIGSASWFRSRSMDLATGMLELIAEIEKLRNRVLQPLTEREIQQALHEGRAKAMAATGDNAWTSLLKQRDEARQQLATVTVARDEACDALDSWIAGEFLGQPKKLAEASARVDRLRKVGK